IKVSVRLQLIGSPGVYAALATVALAAWQGIPLDEIVMGLSRARPLPGRLHAWPAQNGAIVLDDTFSASPPSMLAALDFLKTAHPTGERIAVLGDMRRLGEFNEEGHLNTGKYAAHCVDYLIVKGNNAERIAQGALLAGFAA